MSSSKFLPTCLMFYSVEVTLTLLPCASIANENVEQIRPRRHWIRSLGGTEFRLRRLLGYEPAYNDGNRAAIRHQYSVRNHNRHGSQHSKQSDDTDRWRKRERYGSQRRRVSAELRSWRIQLWVQLALYLRRLSRYGARQCCRLRWVPNAGTKRMRGTRSSNRYSPTATLRPLRSAKPTLIIPGYGKLGGCERRTFAKFQPEFSTK